MGQFEKFRVALVLARGLFHPGGDGRLTVGNGRPAGGWRATGGRHSQSFPAFPALPAYPAYPVISGKFGISRISRLSRYIGLTVLGAVVHNGDWRAQCSRIVESELGLDLNLTHYHAENIGISAGNLAEEVSE